MVSFWPAVLNVLHYQERSREATARKREWCFFEVKLGNKQVQTQLTRTNSVMQIQNRGREHLFAINIHNIQSEKRFIIY